MNFLQTMELSISTLSPVHVGCGEDFQPGSYVIEDEMLYHFDPSQAYLTAEQLKKLDAIVSSNQGDMLVRLKKFFFEAREQLIPAASRVIPVTRSIEKNYKDNLNNPDAKADIDRMFNNQLDDLPVIPGSSIKGSIRTAFLSYLNKGDPLPSDEAETAKRGRADNQKFQRRLMNGAFHTDALRLLKVGDARYLTPALPATQVLFAVSRRKKPLLKAGAQQDAGQGIPTQKECIPAKRYRAFNFALSCQQAHPSYPDKTPPANRMLINNFSDLAKVCNAFYRPLFENELELLSERDRGFGEKAWVDNLRLALAGELGQRLKSNQACLLRVGRHSGAVSVTVEGARFIKIMQGGKNPPLYQADTKQIWLAADDSRARSNMLPFGWVLLEPRNAPAIECLAKWFSQTSEAAALKQQKLLQTLADKKHHIATQQQAALQKASEQAAQEHAAAQAEAERLAKLANLSPAMQEIEKFIDGISKRIEQLRGGKEKLNEGKHNEAKKLVTDAKVGWSAAEKQALFEAIQEHLPKVVGGLQDKKAQKEVWKKMGLNELIA